MGVVLMWYSWTDQAAFDAWHGAVCTQLHLPRPGENEGSGQIDTIAQWTTAYTTVVGVAPNDWRAFVDDAVAATCATGIGVPCDPPPAPEFVI